MSHRSTVTQLYINVSTALAPKLLRDLLLQDTGQSKVELEQKRCDP